MKMPVRIELVTNENKLYYLASPYSHPDPYIKHLRYEQINKIAVLLIERGLLLIEPIASCHDKSLKYKLPTGYEYWKTRDRALIKKSDGVIVAMMDGWKESIGVTDEVEYATSLDKPILFLNPTTLEVEHALHYRPSTKTITV